MSKLTKFFALLFISMLMLAACRVAPEASNGATSDDAAAAPTAAQAEEATATEAAPAAAAEATEAPAEEAAGDTAAMPESVTIGFMGPLTGGAAFIGQEMLGFAKAVAQIYSEQWGIEVNIVEGDTEINPDVGKIVAEQFVANEAIIGVVGPAGSQVCEATQPVFADAGLAQVTPSCTATSLTQPGTPTFFRPIPTDADQSKTIAGYLLDTLGVTSVYLVDDQSSYSVGLDDEVEVLLTDAGVSVERASVTQEETDFSSVVTAIMAAGVDAVLFPSQIENQEGTLAVQLHEQGYEGIYFLADGGFSLNWVGNAGEAAEGAYVTFFSPDPNLVPAAADMNARYRAITGAEEFGAFGGAGGLTTQVLLEAVGVCVQSGDVSRACVVDALGNLNLESTVLGIPISFGEGNQAAGGFSLFQVQDGAFVLLEQ
ncbi:MAG: branched-chain amino acid ABC transporter substrate-binding protein [Caldilineaceae bacterium]